MKISSSIQQSIEIEITPPFFRKEKSTFSKFVKYRAVIDDNTFIQMTRLSNDYINVSSGLISDHKPDILEAFSKWEAIDEDEFLEAYISAIEALSLVPKLVEDNQKVNILSGR